MRRLFFVASVGTLGLLSCTESPTATGRGDLSLEVVAVTVAPQDGSAEAPAAAPGAAGMAAPLSAPSRVGPIMVDSARIVLSGPESRIISATPGTDVTISNLPVGSYTAVLEGWGDDELVYGGTVTSIQVTGGATNSVTQVLFAPTRLEFIAINEAVQLTTPAGTAWSSGNGGIVTISPTGVLTAAGNGTAAVTGTLGNSTVQIVALVAQQVDSVEVTPANPTIAAGTTQQFAATAYDSLGTAVSGVIPLWVSTNHNIATISQSGLATGVGQGDVTITASIRGQPGSSGLTVNAAAAQLKFLVEPGSTTAGEPFATAIQVEVQTANGTRVTTASAAVTLAITANPSGGSLVGTRTVNAVNGVATFSGLEIDNAGVGYTLTASAGGLTDATSAAFDVDGGVPTQLVFETQPVDGLPDYFFFGDVVVEIRNASGGRTSSTDAITLAIDQNPANGTLGGIRTVNAVNGVATFSDLWINNPGPNYTLTASASGLARATSVSFNVGAVAVFANTSYVDYIPGDFVAEASNLEETYESIGWDVTTFTDVEFPTSVLDNVHVLSIPEQEYGSIFGVMSAGAIANVAAFVSNGGTLIIHHGGVPTVSFLNGVFGYTVAGGSAGSPNSITGSASGTSFQGGPASLGNPSATGPLLYTSLPLGSLIMYSANVSLDAAVAVIPYGFGQIVFVGWDWYNAPPVGTAVGGNLWAQVLARATLY